MTNTSTSELILGDYRVGRTLGEGTFGKVRLAIHSPTEQQVAVKTLQKEKISDQADIQRITRQICILKLLHHPNIAQLYQIIETATDIHLVMQFAAGGELFDHIVKHRRIEQKQAVKIMQQVLAGIEYIHKNGIVHRDLKPENLLLDEQGNIKIVDFGLSNQYKVGERLKTACGSPCYAAPEMIAGKKYQCKAVDIWSSGIILYAMLCGFLPFEDPNTSKLYKKIIAGDFQLPKHLSSASKHILQNILNTNPDSRYSIEQIRSSDWYNQTSKRYIAKGTIVGEVPLEVNENVLLVMESRSIDPNLVRNFVLSNRHNSLTAHYYLLKKKMEKDPTILKKITLTSRPNRSESPLIYRPNTRINQQLVVPPREKSQSRNQTRDDSFNASSIINSLVAANKQKLALPHPVAIREDNFEVKEEFKIFPRNQIKSVHFTSPQVKESYKQNSNNNSSFNEELLNSRRYHIYVTKPPDSDRPSFSPNTLRPPVRFIQSSHTPSTPQKAHLTSIFTQNVPLSTNDKSRPSQPPLAQKAEDILNTSRLEEMNRRKQELSQQLKQISVKIDNSINQLKKRNTSLSNSSTMTPKPEEKGQNYQQNPRFKTEAMTPKTVRIHYQTGQTTHFSQNFSGQFINPKEGINVSPVHTPQIRIRTQESRIINVPRVHLGPFNSQCLFPFSPQGLLCKIESYLRRKAIPYCKIDNFTLLMKDVQLSIESLQGVEGYHLVDFSQGHEENENIINFLHQ